MEYLFITLLFLFSAFIFYVSTAEMTNLFEKRNQEPSDSDGILGKGILHLDAIISDLTAKQAEQEKEITRLQRLVTQHDQDNSITNRYNVELVEDDKEHNTQTVRLTPKRTKSLSEEKTHDGN